jgi:hypothetical protein
MARPLCSLAVCVNEIRIIQNSQLVCHLNLTEYEIWEFSDAFMFIVVFLGMHCAEVVKITGISEEGVKLDTHTHLLLISEVVSQFESGCKT